MEVSESLKSKTRTAMDISATISNRTPVSAYECDTSMVERCLKKSLSVGAVRAELEFLHKIDSQGYIFPFISTYKFCWKKIQGKLDKIQ